MRTISPKLFDLRIERHNEWLARVESDAVREAAYKASMKQAQIESLISQLVELSDESNKSVIAAQLKNAMTIRTRANDRKADFDIIIDERKASKEIAEIESAYNFADIKANALLFRTNMKEGA